MTQEEKQLLLIDLCARLPYKPKALVNRHLATVLGIDENVVIVCIDGNDYKDEIVVLADDNGDDIKLYLRPMSSMTKKEREKLRQEQIKDEQLFADCIKNHPEMRGLIIPHFAANWCDKNMFDYRGLIEKGLAIEVTKENNPYKE